MNDFSFFYFSISFSKDFSQQKQLSHGNVNLILLILLVYIYLNVESSRLYFCLLVLHDHFASSIQKIHHAFYMSLYCDHFNHPYVKDNLYFSFLLSYTRIKFDHFIISNFSIQKSTVNKKKQRYTHTSSSSRVSYESII